MNIARAKNVHPRCEEKIFRAMGVKYIHTVFISAIISRAEIEASIFHYVHNIVYLPYIRMCGYISV